MGSMTMSSISQTEDLRALLQVLENEIPVYLEPFASEKAHGPSLKLTSPKPTAEELADGAVTEPQRRIIHACEKIVALLQGPTVKLTVDASGHLTSTAISIAIKLQLPRIISSDANAPTTLDELAKATSASPDLLARVLRYLTQRFIFEEPSPSCYIQNVMSKALADPAAGAWIDLIATEYQRGSSSLLDLFSETKYQIPPDPQPTALTKAFGSKHSYYDYMRLENPDLGRKYSLSMSLPSDGPHMLYPWAQLPPGSRVVDVGGGSGHITAPIAKLHPQLRYILQDSPDTIAYGKSIYGSAGLPIEWQKVNFFEEQKERGARAYILRHILVDWPDRHALRILKSIANAMDKDSRLLICDAVVPDRHGEESDSLMNVLDLNLLTMFNSKERSLKQWKELLGSVDRALEVVKVWRADVPVGQEAVLEAKLKD